MKKIFENVVLAVFTTHSGKEPFMCFKAESGKAQKERLLKVFFDRKISPIFDGTEAEKEVDAMKPKEKANFALSVIGELYRLVIAPKLEQGDNSPDVTFAVCLMAIHIVRSKDFEPLESACKAVRLETFAPLCNPSLRPDKVRTFEDEVKLQAYWQTLAKWNKVFVKMCHNVCKP